MQQYECPNCGAPLVFRSKISVHTTCVYCQSMVVRHDMNLEAIGEVAELLDDMSPFQVGTMGRFEEKGFILVGRIKIVYPKGTWSEWFALFDDGTEGWLAEAQGHYMMTFEEKGEWSGAGWRSSPRPLDEVEIKGKRFIIEDVKHVVYFGSEGELPFPFVPKERATSIDMRADDQTFATVSISDHGEQVFLGRYADFDSFQFQNLRTLDGW
jgi:hypothetical protein